MSLWARFCARAARAPDALALAGPRETWTYARLQQRAAGWARDLPAGAIVSLPWPRGADLVSGMLASWAAEAAFVVLTPDLPPAVRRAREMEAGVTHRFDGEGRVVRVGEGGEPGLAYVAFTSGSSGRPRGAFIEAEGLLRVLDAQIEAFELGPGDRSLWLLAPGFDASISDIGTALLSGATLHWMEGPALRDPARLLAEVQRRAITYVDLPPSLLPHLDRCPPSLRTLVVGGEVAPAAAVRTWSQRLRLFDVYGPTEVSICTHVARCWPERPSATLGRALPHVLERVVDGELWLGGPAVARRLVGAPEGVLHTEAGVRWYRSGDRVAQTPEGLRFLGRLDRQVQVNGVRVEPEAVELALAELGISATVELEAGCLVGSYEGSVGPEAWLPSLQARLPASHCPTRWRSRSRLARNRHGKRVAVGEGRGWAPLFAEILGLEHVRPDDDFFALGGSSMDAIRLLGRAAERGLALNAETFYAARTPSALEAAAPVSELRTVQALSRQAGLHPVLRCARPGPRPSDPALLLTGGTGFLGTELRARLEGRPVLHLVRAYDEVAGRARVGGAPVVLGDLAAPRFGLDPAAWKQLVGRVGTVLHLGAKLSIVEPYEGLVGPNVEGTRSALALAEQAGARMVYASTLSVFASASRRAPVWFESDDLESAGGLFGGYAQSKWVAEALVRDAPSPAVILRYGLLVPARSGPRAHRPPAGDWLTRFVRAVAREGRVPAGLESAAFDATPVDAAAEASLRLLDAPTGTYHIAGAAPVPVPRLIDAIRRQGYRVEAAPLDSPVGRLGCGGEARFRGFDLWAASGTRFDTSAARALGFEPPPTTDADLDAMVGGMLEVSP